ncbi:hypothetical protein BDF19DRAFT_260570 [Syncephalis fuscata]|nr:hypothetical protein BDF19DRAFT_260570 [Syncephalis fuscata]
MRERHYEIGELEDACDTRGHYAAGERYSARRSDEYGVRRHDRQRSGSPVASSSSPPRSYREHSRRDRSRSRSRSRGHDYSTTRDRSRSRERYRHRSRRDRDHHQHWETRDDEYMEHDQDSQEYDDVIIKIDFFTEQTGQFFSFRDKHGNDC